MNPMTPLLVWGLFPRLLGFVYLIAFASLLSQVVPLACAAGVSPIKPQLRPHPRRFPPVALPAVVSDPALAPFG